MDAALFKWINRIEWRTGWAHGVARFYAVDGILLFAALLLVALLVTRRRGDADGIAGTVWAAAAAVVALGIGQLLGGLVDRARPYAALQGVHVLVDRTSDVSFPSDHATAVGAVAVGLLYVERRLGLVALVGALLMAVARVYAGAHYPLDVVAGLALGGLVAAVGHRLVVPWLRKLVDVLGRSPARRLVGRAG